eukprot:Pompholyxophrys_punicea_v1_NODE_523_length_1771_cov_1.611305.p2 type:complete len:351 gc:universal NODE_523_length_1771_cov_1.611305:1079-27(-)
MGLLDERVLLDMDPVRVRLFQFMDVHEAEHGTASLPHPAVTLPTAAGTGLAVSGHKAQTLDVLELVGVLQVRREALLEPPSQSDLPAPQRQKAKVEFEPVVPQSRNSRVKALPDAFLKQHATQWNLGGDGVEDGVVGVDVPLQVHLVHLLKQSVSLLPEIAPSAGADGAVVYVHVWRDALDLHPFHQLEGDVGAATLFHARHGRTKDDNVLRDAHFRHLIQKLEALTILQACEKRTRVVPENEINCTHLSLLPHENPTVPGRSRESDEDEPFSHALIALRYETTVIGKFLVFISSNISRTSSHCIPLSSAVIVALYVTMEGEPPHACISRNSCRAFSHCCPLARAEIAAE